ncbi:MAG: DUF1648 domain-containing protein [Gammaproteobacteria bacterium]
MSQRQAYLICGFLIAFMFAVALWAISDLPSDAHIAVHWGADGRPNGWMGKWVGLLFNPVVAIVVWVAVSTFPPGAFGPGKIELSPDARRTVLVCVLLLQAAVEVAIALGALRTPPAGAPITTLQHADEQISVLSRNFTPDARENPFSNSSA